MSTILRIGICDDESHFRESLGGSIAKILLRLGIDHSMIHFSSGEELLDGYLDIDILFLDIQMRGINGIDAAKEIRKRDENVCIIFISAFPEYAAEGYRVNAFRYITKPFDERELEAELTGAIGEVKRSNAVSLVIQNEKSSCRILTSNIVYIEVRGRKTVIHTTGDEIESNESLGKYETKISDQFFYRCHQGYLVNLRYIDSVAENSIALRGDGFIPLSRYKKKGLMKMLTSYWGGMM